MGKNHIGDLITLHSLLSVKALPGFFGNRKNNGMYFSETSGNDQNLRGTQTILGNRERRVCRVHIGMKST